MSIVLIKQYTEKDNQKAINKALQADFTQRGITTVVVPSEVDVEWLNNGDLAIIKRYADTTKVKEAAEQVQADLLEKDIDSVILPTNVNIEVAPQALDDFGIESGEKFA